MESMTPSNRPTEPAAESAHPTDPHEITPQCPLSCLHMNTVDDLLRIFVEVGLRARTGTLPDRGNSGRDLSKLHVHKETTTACPISCLNLPLRTYKRLNQPRSYFPVTKPESIADLLYILATGEIHDFEGIGPVMLKDIHEALTNAGFPQGHYKGLDPRKSRSDPQPRQQAPTE